jgi:hypothetical protein
VKSKWQELEYFYLARLQSTRRRHEDC